MRGVRPPAYLSDLLTRLPEEVGPDELHLHLGHYLSGSEDVRTAQARMNEEVLARAELRDDQAVLDVGCGIGGTLAAVAARHTGMHLVGLNIGLDQLSMAARHVGLRGSNRVRWIQGDADALPFSDGAFDRVIALEAIFHFPSRARFIRQAARVLRAGGRLVLSDLRIAERADPSLLSLVSSGLGPWPDPFGREGPLPALAERAGLVCEEEDVSDRVGPTFEQMLGAAAIADPSRIANAGDRGTAALGRLWAEGALSVVYLTAQLAEGPVSTRR